MAYCQYCQQNKKLIKAHIIPRAFWEIGPQSDGPLMSIYSAPESHPKKRPIGLYDSDILCGDCDGWLGERFDQYASEHLLKAEPYRRVQQEYANVANIYRFDDPIRIKRFIISVLWRAHISSLPEFSGVRLGQYADIARTALTDENALSRFDMVFAEWRQGNRGWLNPDRTNFSGVNTYRLYINRFIAYIKVDRRQFRIPFNRFSFDDSGNALFLVRDFVSSKEADVLWRIASRYDHVFRRYLNK